LVSKTLSLEPQGKKHVNVNPSPFFEILEKTLNKKFGLKGIVMSSKVTKL